MKIKKQLVVLGLLFLPALFFSQEKSKWKLPFNEVVLSVNKTPNYAEGQIGYSGFGAGLNRRFRDSSRVGFIMGIHYIFSSQYLDSYQSSRAGIHSDITYSFHSISFPIGWRFKFGENKKLFIELGANLDVIPIYQKSYTFTSFSPLTAETKTENFNEQLTTFNLSTNFGIGSIVSIKEKEFLIKLDYKIGAANFGETWWPGQPIHDQFVRLSIGYLFNESLNNRLNRFFKDY